MVILSEVKWSDVVIYKLNIYGDEKGRILFIWEGIGWDSDDQRYGNWVYFKIFENDKNFVYVENPLFKVQWIPLCAFVEF